MFWISPIQLSTKPGPALLSFWGWVCSEWNTQYGKCCSISYEMFLFWLIPLLRHPKKKKSLCWPGVMHTGSEFPSDSFRFCSHWGSPPQQGSLLSQGAIKRVPPQFPLEGSPWPRETHLPSQVQTTLPPARTMTLIEDLDISRKWQTKLSMNKLDAGFLTRSLPLLCRQLV